MHQTGPIGSLVAPAGSLASLAGPPSTHLWPWVDSTPDAILPRYMHLPPIAHIAVDKLKRKTDSGLTGVADRVISEHKILFGSYGPLFTNREHHLFTEGHMVGVMHQLFFGFVEKNLGSTAVPEVKRQAGVANDRQYRMDAAYSDEEWQKLVSAAVKMSGKPADEIELAFARYCGGELLTRMAGFFKGCSSTLELLKRQPVIHNMMASSVRDLKARQQITDKFRLEERDGETIAHYTSPNRHCTLYRGLAHWVADYYRERIEIFEPRCLKRGDPECEIHVKYLGKKN